MQLGSTPPVVSSEVSLVASPVSVDSPPVSPVSPAVLSVSGAGSVVCESDAAESVSSPAVLPSLVVAGSGRVVESPPLWLASPAEVVG
jgi:hypothetical protein